MAGKYNYEKHNRRSIRLKGYDYTQTGAYFVTICTQNRECLFGEIQERDMVLNDAGEMVKNAWNNLSNKCPGIAIDECIIMPNHVHGIICIVGAPLVGALALDMRQGIEQNRVDTAKDRAGTRPAPTVLGNIIVIFNCYLKIKSAHF